jgi:transcriptional regulator with GAF, ATPase, and Fis domain
MLDTMGADHESDERFSSIVRSLHAAKGIRDTLQRSVRLAAEMVPGCDEACVSLAHRSRRIDTPAATHDDARRGDKLQYELQEGPCLDAIWTQETVRSDDLLSEGRWPRWAPVAAQELGIRAMLCFQLFTSRDSLGALNLYARQPNAFDHTSADVGYALAAHVAVALSGARELSDMHHAVANRMVIGQAQGVLMERFGLDAAQAFEVLRTAASSKEVSLDRVAAQLVSTGRLPAG